MFKRLAFIAAVLFLYSVNIVAHAEQRIVSLAPHLTEWVFTLNKEAELVGVSDYSDFPEAAKALPRVASHTGVNFEALLTLKPTLVLAWHGGNRPQDIARLQALGLDVFLSSPKTLVDMQEELLALGSKLGANEQAKYTVDSLAEQLSKLKYSMQKKPRYAAFFYMHNAPLMSVSGNTWSNDLIRHCNLNNIFEDADTPYPQVSIEQVLTKQPAIIISSMNQNKDQMRAQWGKWEPILHARYFSVNAAIFQRFTPRVVTELSQLCEQIHFQK
ncbi:cobalamin-binding protein [Aestuariibacter sp. AA17]|uniref:Cobalamin-binding protein n=1 Tax=Fluctibacter corallii TaxID=2984329 RepID=A0ABT3A4W8_9ALTE|nr:cobalamin-binding protein [Aestuariibacter sp. AA17]MCV2883703.1 cobalamin-binding protein [Aestuariibacter sp. AA17]